ncbi:g7629 [Coccomyxa viridis]|uniref:G7629 protein n=1 Tax=Coccomyxa viridis TaxID=1274662 RepID=A0ABP1G0T9_9CHLO
MQSFGVPGLGTIPIVPDLEGRRVLITGGSAGIGKACALAFDTNGCKVAIVGRRRERLDAVAIQMKDALPIVADLSGGDAEMQRVIYETIQGLGGLDIIVNNGAGSTDLMREGTAEQAILSAIQLHVTSCLALVRAAEEELIRNKGAVVNISSTAARVPRGGNPAYGVAKAAQDRLTQDLAFELAPKGVRVNSVLPAAVRTEVFETFAHQQGKGVDDVMQNFAPYHVMDRVGDPNEIAAAVVFLASNAASFITGVNLPVDGGLLLGFWANKTGP